MISTILSILFLILKVIGIILLLLLAIILAVLLVPICYQVEGSKRKNEAPYAKAAVSWFFFAIRCKVSYLSKELRYQLKIFGFTVISNDPSDLEKKEKKRLKKALKKEKNSKKEESKKESKNELKKEESESSHQDELSEASSTDSEILELPEEIFLEESEECSETVAEATQTESKKEFNPNRTPSIKKEDKKEGVSSDGEKNTGSSSKKKKKKNTDSTSKKADSEEKSDEESKESILDKLQKLNDKKTELLQMAEEYQVLALIGIAKKTIFRVLHHILPRHLSGYAHYGMEDPATTGYITALLASFYPAYGRSFHVDADFQEQCLEGQAEGKGHIQLGFFLWILITLLLKKEVRKIIRLFLK